MEYFKDFIVWKVETSELKKGLAGIGRLRVSLKIGRKELEEVKGFE